jgi:hypothetical protein
VDALTDPGNWSAFAITVAMVVGFVTGQIETRFSVKRQREDADRIITLLTDQLRAANDRADRFADTNSRAIEVIREARRGAE